MAEAAERGADRCRVRSFGRFGAELRRKGHLALGLRHLSMLVHGMDGASTWPAVIILALFIGSFLGVLVQRLPQGEGVVAGRSRCPRCGAQLAAYDLIPILSWLALRGRCRTCRAPIGLFYPVIELAAVVIAIWATLVTSGWVLWTSCALGWILLTLAIIDWRHHLLPDVL